MKDLTGMGGGFDPRSAFRCQKDEELRDDITRAAKEIIGDQLKLGLDVITDGEVERGGNTNNTNITTVNHQKTLSYILIAL